MVCLVHLRGSAASLSWFEGGSSVGDPRVALDRGEADIEEAGGGGLGQASFLDGSYDPCAQILRVGLHDSMIAHPRWSGQRLWCSL